MLRLDKAIHFLPLQKSILLVRLSNKTCDLESLLFSEFLNIISVYICIDLIILLDTFLVISRLITYLMYFLFLLEHVLLVI